MPGYPGLYPDNFDLDVWMDAILQTLDHLRKKLGDDYKIIWNGLQQAEIFVKRIWEVMERTDGALVECFATCYLLSDKEGYLPPALWLHSLYLAIRGIRMAKRMFLFQKFPSRKLLPIANTVRSRAHT